MCLVIRQERVLKIVRLTKKSPRASISNDLDIENILVKVKGFMAQKNISLDSLIVRTPVNKLFCIVQPTRASNKIRISPYNLQVCNLMYFILKERLT